MARWLLWFAYWVVWGALWVMLVFRDDLTDVLCAAGVGVIVTASSVLAHRSEHTVFATPKGWVRPFARVPGKIVLDAWLMVVALYRLLVLREGMWGEQITISIDPGGDDPQSAARRAMVTAGICVTPNTVVISHARDEISVHRLVRTGEHLEKRDREWPV